MMDCDLPFWLQNPKNIKVCEKGPLDICYLIVPSKLISFIRYDSFKSVFNIKKLPAATSLAKTYFIDYVEIMCPCSFPSNLCKIKCKSLTY